MRGRRLVARRISMLARSELLEAVGARYRGAPRSERSRILDEFAAVTGYHRKHAIRLLSGAVRDAKVEGCSPGIAKPVTARRCVYGHEIRDALIQLWEVSDRICSKRLRPIVPVLLEALERHGQIAVDEALRSKLLAVSAASIDRLLTEVRLVAGVRPGSVRRSGGASRSAPSTTGAAHLLAGSRSTS